jgi:hypothetical protein
MPRKKRIDDLMEAITFAEAGEVETARGIAAELFPAHAAAGERILAVSGARGFSRRMVEDSIAMAGRLGYGIVALTVSPAMSKLMAKLGRRPARGAWLAPAEFRAQAEARGVPFAHLARGGDPDAAVADVSRRFHRIAFLVVDPGLAAKQRFARVDLPIYYLADA